jgi:hypothetical protein
MRQYYLHVTHEDTKAHKFKYPTILAWTQAINPQSLSLGRLSLSTVLT